MDPFEFGDLGPKIVKELDAESALGPSSGGFVSLLAVCRGGCSDFAFRLLRLVDGDTPPFLVDDDRESGGRPEFLAID